MVKGYDNLQVMVAYNLVIQLITERMFVFESKSPMKWTICYVNVWTQISNEIDNKLL